MMQKNWFAFVLIGSLFVVLGISLVGSAFAVNFTAINEAQSILEQELETKDSFHVFWIIFFLIILAVFMGVMLRMRENSETVFFSIGALIVSVLMTLMLTSPLDFDFQESESIVTVIEKDGSVTESHVTQKVNRVVVFPADDSFRFALSSLFTGIILFNGLYTLFILTNFPLSRSKNKKF